MNLAPQGANQRTVLTFLKLGRIIVVTAWFFILGVTAASFVHELSHALVAWSFGLQIYSIQIGRVIYEYSPEVFLRTLVYTAGGFGQALFAFLLFLFGRYLFKIFTANKGQLSIDNDRLTKKEQIKHLSKQLLPGVVFGFELIFLSLALHGVISGVLEGFFNSIYVVVHSYDAIGALASVLCLVFSFVVLYSHQKQQLKA
jgi:hypothetical protein